jgi:uncharacterized protein YciI
MGYFTVVREAGPGWAAGKTILEQPGVADHAAFMNALVAEGFVVLGGPLGGREHDPRVLLVVQADGEADVQARLAEDPWVLSGQLRIVSVESWKLLVGEERLSRVEPARGSLGGPRPA